MGDQFFSPFLFFFVCLLLFLSFFFVVGMGGSGALVGCDLIFGLLRGEVFLVIRGCNLLELFDQILSCLTWLPVVLTAVILCPI